MLKILYFSCIGFYKDVTGTVYTSKLVNYNTYNKFVAQQEDTPSSAVC